MVYLLMTWVLVIMITVNFGRAGGMTGTVPGFISQEECKRAGETVRVALEGRLRDVEYVCVVQTKSNGTK
jgi:hypothetical protein